MVCILMIVHSCWIGYLVANKKLHYVIYPIQRQMKGRIFILATNLLEL
jgi:predicted DNA-binding transcriptional regulator